MQVKDPSFDLRSKYPIICLLCKDRMVSELFLKPMEVLLAVYSEMTRTKGNPSLLVVIQVTASPWIGFLHKFGSVTINSAVTTF